MNCSLREVGWFKFTVFPAVGGFEGPASDLPEGCISRSAVRPASSPFEGPVSGCLQDSASELFEDPASYFLQVATSDLPGCPTSVFLRDAAVDVFEGDASDFFQDADSDLPEGATSGLPEGDVSDFFHDAASAFLQDAASDFGHNCFSDPVEGLEFDAWEDRPLEVRESNGEVAVSGMVKGRGVSNGEGADSDLGVSRPSLEHPDSDLCNGPSSEPADDHLCEAEARRCIGSGGPGLGDLGLPETEPPDSDLPSREPVDPSLPRPEPAEADLRADSPTELPASDLPGLESLGEPFTEGEDGLGSDGW